VTSRTNRAFFAFAVITLVSPLANAALIYGTTTSNGLVSFDSAAPGTLLSSVAISGLQANESVIGIDFRPANGLLYALTRDAAEDGRIYTINTATGAATLAVTLVGPPSDAAGFGTDFNPVPDRLRLVDTNQNNLRINVDNGVVAPDSLLAYAPGDPRFGTIPTIGASAYTNSFAGATTTTLYGIDIALAQLVTQAPPNAGLLNTVGPLGVAPNSVERAGFDILAGPGGTNTAFAMLSTQTSPNGFYTLNLTSGVASLVGDIGVGRDSIVDIAAFPGGGGEVPLPAGILLAIPAAAAAMFQARKHRKPLGA
jgi:hypothetical protein